LDEKGDVDSFLVMLEDITEEKQLQAELEYQVMFSNNILDSLPGIFYMIDEDFKLVRVNRNVYDLFGMKEDNLKNMDLFALIAPREREKIEEKIKQAYLDGYAEVETVLVAQQKEYHFFISGTLLEQNGNKYIIGNGINITDRVRSEQNNEVLLKEVHHRVKNNLAIISGLLEMELLELENEKSKLPLQRSVNRIHSIAKVHEMLYDSNNLSSINLKQYLNKLSEDIEQSMSYDGKCVIYTEIGDIEMNINDAIPLGLLLNELITNSLKYAFEENEEGIIGIQLSRSNGQYKFSYCDNGRGFKTPFDFESVHTMGMQIISMLIRQLGATYKLDTQGQFKLQLEFEFKPNKRGSHSNLLV
jgi:PAS domain S-box-containing protein